MIKITKLAGHGKPDYNVEHVRLERGQMQKSRLRQSTNMGTDVAIHLPDGTTLRHGDLVAGDGMTIMIIQKPELVGVVKPAGDPVPADMWMLAAHAIGNMHRPVSVDGGRLTFPLQDTAEREVFTGMLERLGPDTFKMDVAKIVFEPHAAAHVMHHG